MSWKHSILIQLLAILVIAPMAVRADNAAAVWGLIARIAPGHVQDFLVETIPASPGENAFEVDSAHGKIVLRGDGALSQAVALNWYLKHVAFVDVSWYADDAVRLPARLPLPQASIRKATKANIRFFMNYCTFGYTMPFWHWREWERAIDWMALNGINLPLAQSGNEYIWQKVWRQYGLTDEQIRAFFTGPAHLPWNRMANIDKWDGPLPQSYIDGQHSLEKQILARERSLGMTPVLCAFAGHVPEALRHIHPEMKISRIPGNWSGFSPEYGTWFLDPLDPQFAQIALKFLQEQEEEYGKSNYYGTDPFNEINPPSWEASYLRDVAKSIYDGMARLSPNAVWLQMAWTFAGDRKHWTDERLSAMIRAVPNGHMILIDYACENQELYRSTRAFYGAPFIWSYLGNFGGNTYVVGPIQKINERLTDAMNNPELPNFAGVGATLEGLNNPVVYEMLFERIWDGSHLDLQTWVRDEARSRAGGPDANVEKAWDIMREKVLVDNVDPTGGHGVIFQERYPSLRGEANTRLSSEFPYNNADLLRAWSFFLKAGPEARQSPAYERDLVDVTRQALGNIGLIVRSQMAAAYERKDVTAFQNSSNEFMELGRDLDEFLGTRTEFMLGPWIEGAKSWAADKSEEQYYEQNARTILTVWGGSKLTDYAGRQWNGLMRDYYLPRWQELIDGKLTELKGGEQVNRQAFMQQCRDLDWKFARAGGGDYAMQARGNPVAMSSGLFRKYASLGPSTSSDATAHHIQ